MRYSRANTKLATHAVPHGTLPGSAADFRSCKELGAADDCIAGIPNAPPSDGGQPPVVSTTSPSSNNGGEDDPEEITPFLGIES